jgi:hypothetical protein
MCVLTELPSVALSSSMHFLLPDMTAFIDLIAVAQLLFEHILASDDTDWFLFLGALL